MSSQIRIVLALALGFLAAFIICLANGLGFYTALQNGFIYALIVGAIVAILSWGMDLAVEKGYPGWVGFVLVLFLNIIGLLVLALLPARTPAAIH